MISGSKYLKDWHRKETKFTVGFQDRTRAIYHPTIHLLNRYFLSTSYKPGPVSIARATVESKGDTVLAVVGFTAQEPMDGVIGEVLRHSVWVTFLIFKAI